MRTETDKEFPSRKNVYLYPCDLENMSTIELINIIKTIRRTLQYIAEDLMQENGKPFESIWIEFARGSNKSFFTMKWMVKKVLSTRPHIETSKIVKRQRRQYQAKHHVRLK